jgi:putative FmdB family regulatory protein
MPTYEYHCDACGHDFEEFQSITSKPTRKCPKCGKLKVRRLIGTGSGMIFKGSGFYITDYRSEGYKDSAKADQGGGKDKDAKPADAKPADTKAGDSKPAESKPATEAPKPATPPPAEPKASKSASKSARKTK